VALLTDYHVHLRPDVFDASPERYFTEENVGRYLDAARQAGIAELGVAEHVYRFAEALEISRHPFWVAQATDDLAEYCEFVRSTPLRLGIEADYVAGAEDRIGNLLDRHQFDFVVGSVHMLGDRFVDHADYDVWEGEADPDRVWTSYFEHLAEAARCGLFDVLAHPDLVKMWGPERPWPERDPRSHFEPALEAISEAGVAVELSTAGLRKPVGDFYPSKALCEMCVEAGVPFALSSDAHAPDQIGYAYDRAVKLLAELGVSEICAFAGRERRMEQVG
jgi:histidinol-phosphatase (PHP family)